MKDIIVICKKCGNKVSSTSLKMDPDEKVMMCQNCLRNKQIHREIQQEFGKRPQKPMFEKPVKVMHKCPSCNYSFRVNPETKVPKNCPYCNKLVDFSSVY